MKIGKINTPTFIEFIFITGMINGEYVCADLTGGYGYIDRYHRYYPIHLYPMKFKQI